MPTYKVTILFNAGTVDSSGNAARSAGFSESFYSSPTASLEQVRAKMANLCTVRAALMPANVRIVGQRIQSLDPVGATISYDTVYVGNSTAQNDLPQAALQWTVRGNGTPNSRIASQTSAGFSASFALCTSLARALSGTAATNHERSS